jgi:hypothetical protein
MRLSGQAARGVGRVLHAAATVLLGLLVITAIVLAVVAWRLSQGPMDVSWFSGRIEAAVNAGQPGMRLEIGGTALAWEGFRQGLDRPLDLRLSDVTLADASGARKLAIPRAQLSLSVGHLLVGRVVPRTLDLDGPRLDLVRDEDGGIVLDFGAGQAPVGGDAAGQSPGQPAPLTEILAELSRPAASDQTTTDSVFSQLRRVRIRDATVVVTDRQIGAVWRAPQANIVLTRRASGGVDGAASLSLALGGQRAEMSIAAELTQNGQATHVRARLTPVAPAELARAAAALAPFAALDAPVGFEADLELGSRLELVRGRVSMQAGAGQARVGTGSVAFLRAAAVVSGTPGSIRLETAQVELPPSDGATPTTLRASGSARREGGRVGANLTLTLDRLAFTDVPRLWPAGIADHARDWLVQNITAGTARNGHVELELAATDDLSELSVSRATGALDGDGLMVHWLRPISPLEQGQAQLRILDPNTLEIQVQSGRQRGGPRGGALTIRSGRVRITGLAARDQVASIEADIGGSLANAIALLREPRLELLDRHPIELKDPGGEASVNLSVNVPLETHVQIGDIGIHANAHLTQAHLTGLIAGRDLDQGTLDLDATQDAMTVKGRALLGGIAAQIDGSLDFRSGPATQVVQRIAVSGRAGAGQLSAAGLDAGETLFGEVPLQAVLTERRNGDGEVTVDADLTQATLTVPPLMWRKPIGVPAKASARVILGQDRLRGIDHIILEGTGLSVRAVADCIDGQIVAVRLSRGLVGRTEATGVVRLPAGRPIVVELSGPLLDASAKLTEKPPKRDKPKGEPAPGPAWMVDARFDRVLLARDQSASQLLVRGRSDGRVIQDLSITGMTGAAAPFSVQIGPGRTGRRLTVSAADAGGFLRGLAYVRTMEAGRLSINGVYDDATPGHPLSATAEVDDFRIRGAPALAKLLQAMTLYGLLDVLRGPGVGFSRLVAPFRLDDDGLLLNDARAFSPSLGLTAKGRIDLDAERADIEGTIVPAYFFNSLLGNIPLVGKLFSPEQGGGVFAARYTLRGPLEDPAVFVNPLSALTPGFLRELFGIF